VALDLETTGLLSEQDSIVEIGAVKFAGDDVIETFESFVAPRQPLPYRVQRLTGIRPADLVGAPSLGDLAPRLRAFLGDLPLVGHSVPFDAAFLRRNGLARRNPLVDTYELASALLPDLPSYTLEAVGAALGVASPTYHRALPDALLARDVFLALLRRLEALEPGALNVLGRLAVATDWSPGYFVRAALRARGRAGDRIAPHRAGAAPMGHSGTLGDLLASKLGLDPAVLALAVAREAGEDRSSELPAHAGHVAQALEQGGGPVPSMGDLPGDGAPVEHGTCPADPNGATLVADTLPAAPDGAQAGRAGLQAAGALAATCAEQGVTVLLELEQDTEGILACLEPFLDVAARTSQRVIVAAANAARASHVAHLVRTYAPAALTRRGLPPDQLVVAEVGEQAAYLCLHRWFGAATLPRDGGFPRELTRGLAKLAVWSTWTRTGYRREVSLSGQELLAWDRVRAGHELADSTAGCAYRDRGYCFTARAEQAARLAGVVVTTHAALAETLGGYGLAPEAERVIVLDAQHFEDELRRARSWSLERKELLGALASLAEIAPGGARAGLLHLMAQRDAAAPEVTWFAQVARARTATEAFFAALGRLQTEAQRHGARSRDSGDASDQAVRLDGRVRQLKAWPEVEACWTTLEKRLRAVSRLAGEVAERTATVGGGGCGVAADGIATELLAARRMLDETCAQVALALAIERPDTVRWLRLPQAPPARPGMGTPPGQQPPAAGDVGGESPGLCTAPVEVGTLLAPLRAPGRALALVGSALAFGGDFEYTSGALGLRGEEVQSLAITADRATQTLLLLPEDAAEPNAPSYQRQLDEVLVTLGTALAGRLVVLFPSHAALRAACAGIKGALEQRDVLVLAQGLDGSARQLWQTFRSQPRVALLGAGTFWDGAGQVGTPPSCVVVARLPFPSLSDPLLAARAEAWQDPQAQFVVPYAALKLRQALNGLAWSHGQRNVVVLFDRRVRSRAYGATVLATLPPCAVRDAPIAAIAGQVALWVDGSAGG
jgi:DNA polymerase III epsilon subunit family exonuclease